MGRGSEDVLYDLNDAMNEVDKAREETERLKSRISDQMYFAAAEKRRRDNPDSVEGSEDEFCDFNGPINEVDEDWEETEQLKCDISEQRYIAAKEKLRWARRNVLNLDSVEVTNRFTFQWLIDLKKPYRRVPAIELPYDMDPLDKRIFTEKAIIHGIQVVFGNKVQDSGANGYP